MFRKLIEKLVEDRKEHRLAHENLLKQQHNDEVVKSILKDLEDRIY